MNSRTLAGVAGIVVVVALAVVGASTFLENYLFDVPEAAHVGSTFAVLAVTAAFVIVLAAIGVRGGRFLQNPYW